MFVRRKAVYDLVIKNGTIVDGTGDSAYVSDIAEK